MRQQRQQQRQQLREAGGVLVDMLHWGLMAMTACHFLHQVGFEPGIFLGSIEAAEAIEVDFES